MRIIKCCYRFKYQYHCEFLIIKKRWMASARLQKLFFAVSRTFDAAPWFIINTGETKHLWKSFLFGFPYTLSMFHSRNQVCKVTSYLKSFLLNRYCFTDFMLWRSCLDTIASIICLNRNMLKRIFLFLKYISRRSARFHKAGILTSGDTMLNPSKLIRR